VATGNFTAGDVFVATDDNTVGRRQLTNTASVAWDLSTPGQIKATATGSFDPAGTAAAAVAAHEAASDPHPGYLKESDATATYQPLNAVLTALGGSGMSVFSRNLHVNVTPVLSTAVSSEEDLMSYTLPGGTLSTNKDVVEILVWGAFSAAARTKQIRVKFGATTIFNTGSASFGATDFLIRVRVYRTGAATQVSIAEFAGDTVLVTTTALRAAPTETLASDVTIKVTSEVGAGAAAGDTRQSGFDVSVRRAA